MNYVYTARMGGYAGNIGGFKGQKFIKKEVKRAKQTSFGKFAIIKMRK